MKKNIVLSMCASLLVLASCDYNEKNFPGFDELTNPKDVQTLTMDLADADYKTIAGLSANGELALSKDPEGQTFVSALEAVGKNKYFTEEAQAAWYLPAFINEKNPYLSDGSKVTINYNNFENLPEYLKDFNSISAYDLSAADYKKVWGEEISVSFLSPSTVKQIPALLKEAVSKPAEGAMRQVNYAYSETEPSLGGGGSLPDPEPTYTSIGDVLKATSGTFDVKGEVIAATAKSYIVKDATGSIRVYVGKLPNCAVGDVVVVSGDIESKQGLNRFKSTSTSVIADRSATFAYPAPTAMTSDDLAAYINNPDIKYVTYEGTFKIVDNTTYKSYNVDFGGDTNVGSIVDPLIVDPSWDNATVVVTGYLAGVSGSTTKYVNTFITSIVLKSNTEPVPTPVGVISLTDAGSQLAKGVVTAVHAQGFMLGDGTGSMLVYTKTAPEVAVKDVVTVAGTTSVYQGAMQFGNNGLTVTKVGTTDNLVTSVPIVMDTEKWDMFMAKTHPVYAAITGSLKENSGKYSVVLDGMPVAECNLNYIDATLIEGLVAGDNVTVIGYLTGVSGSTTKYGNMMVTSVAKVMTAGLRALAITRAAAPQPTKSVVYRYDAAADAWKEYKATEATVAVLQPADYNTMGAAYVGKPDETLPVYLQQTRQYAKKDDKVGVVYYKDSNKTIVIDEFAFDGATWTKTTVSTPSVIVFLKNQGIWVEAKVYYASSFLNDEGGFTVQDINLGDLKKVWSVDAKYGWKASAFSGGNKEAESWIVSPEIDLKKSAAPVLKFDAAINYLNGEDRANYFGVLVSTNYVDDVTTADWTELTVENWPEGTSWDFTTITPVDLSAYKDQTIRIAFRYKSDLKAAITAEVKNMSVQE